MYIQPLYSDFEVNGCGCPILELAAWRVLELKLVVAESCNPSSFSCPLGAFFELDAKKVTSPTVINAHTEISENVQF